MKCITTGTGWTSSNIIGHCCNRRQLTTTIIVAGRQVAVITIHDEHPSCDTDNSVRINRETAISLPVGHHGEEELEVQEEYQSTKDAWLGHHRIVKDVKKNILQMVLDAYNQA